MDKLSPARRSHNMSRIRSKNTVPELVVRRTAHALGYRFRLHRKDLPGKPDLVFPRLRAVIFVQGCFWHLHEGCREGRIPGSRREYWEPKLTRNVDRDRAAQGRLTALGWSVLTVWECEVKDAEALRGRLADFLSGGRGA